VSELSFRALRFSLVVVKILVKSAAFTRNNKMELASPKGRVANAPRWQRSVPGTLSLNIAADIGPLFDRRQPASADAPVVVRTYSLELC
jgi:hypothetical protein